MDIRTIIHTIFGLALAAPTDESVPTDESIATDAAFLEQAIEAFEAMARARAVPASPVLALRIADVVSAWSLVRTLETQVRQALAPAPSDTDDSVAAREKPKLSTLLSAASKAWDRLRKALKNFEDSLPEPVEEDALSSPSCGSAPAVTVPGSALSSPQTGVVTATAAPNASQSRLLPAAPPPPLPPASASSPAQPSPSSRSAPTRREILAAANAGLRFP